MDTEEAKAKLSASERENLKDADFAYIDSKGGRHLPINDEAHVRAAMSRFDQTAFESDHVKNAAKAKILVAAKKFGIDVEQFGKSAQSDDEDLETKGQDIDPRELPEIEYKALPFSLDTAGDELGPNEFKGHAAVAGNVDDVGDVIDLAGLAAAATEFKATGKHYSEHDWKEPIGLPLEAKADSVGLFVHGRISETTRGKDVLTLMRDGVIKHLSIGYKATKARYLSDAEGKSLLGDAEYKNAKERLPLGKNRIRHITGLHIFDVSPVNDPANTRAAIHAVKSAPPLSGTTLEDHFSAVQDANDEVIARFRGLAELRGKSGRTLGAANVSRLSDMRDALTGQLDLIDGLIADAEAGKNAEPVEDNAETKAAARREYLRFLKMQAGL